MPALQVKDCPASVYEELRECATRENRSISQQALTIIEGYLGIREQAVSPIDQKMPENKCSYNSLGSHERYLEKRRNAFERIAKLQPIPVSKKSPSSADILHQVREDDAR